MCVCVGVLSLCRGYVTIPPRTPEYINFFETISNLAGDHLVVPISHISLRHKIYNQGSGGKWTKNKRRLVLTQVQGGWFCDTVHSLAWISSEISTKLHGMPTHLDWSSVTAAGLYLMWLVSQMSGVDCPLPLCVPRRQLTSLGSFFQLLTLWRSLAYFRSRPRSRVQILYLVSRQNRQRDRLLSAPSS